MKRYDVLVVGGGPVGSRVAAMLSRTGHSVAVLEKKNVLGGPVCCTGIVSQECLNRFALSDDLILRQLSSARVFSPSGRMLRLQRNTVQASVIDRSALNAFMARCAQDNGAEYHLGRRVESIQIKEDGVIAEVSDAGSSYFFAGRAVVLATGFGSGLKPELGLGKMRDWVVGAQAEVEVKDIDEIEIYLGWKFAPGSFGWLVPATTSRALVGLMTQRNAATHLEKLISWLKAQGKIASSEVKPLYRGITLRPPSKTYSHRLLLVGDAAGQVKPLTGGGIYFGFLCADMAAAVLHQALQKDDLSARSLASYQRAWRRLLEREISLGYRTRRLYSVLSDRQIEFVLNLVQKRGLVESLNSASDISFDWHGRAILQAMRQMVFPFSQGVSSEACDLSHQR